MAQLQAYPYDEIPERVNGYLIPDQSLIRRLPGATDLHLAARMGVLFVELSPEHGVAVMPVAGNEQPYGLLHGGAYCVIGETLGSYCANLHAGDDAVALGVDINATHTGSASSGFVTAVCTAIHLGRTLAVHEIVVSDERGRRCSTVRITNTIRPRVR